MQRGTKSACPRRTAWMWFAALLGLLLALSACTTAAPGSQGNVDATVVAIIAATAEARNAQAAIAALKVETAAAATIEAEAVVATAAAATVEAEAAVAAAAAATIQAEAANATAAAATIKAEAAVATAAAATLTAAVTNTPVPATSTRRPTSTSAPTRTPPPTPTPVPTNTPRPRPSPTVSNSPVFIGFETWGTWKRGDEPYGTFVQSTGQVKGGAYSGELSYNFPANEPKNYVVFHQRHAIPGRPDAILAWVYGDGSKHFLNLWIVDARNQTWQFTFGQIQHTGWQQMVARLDPAAGWPNQAISPASATTLVYPLQFDAIVLDGYREDMSFSGTIYLDRISVPDSALSVN